MTNLEFCRKQRKLELPKFVAVLKAVPPGRLDYRPDPKARTAVELSWLLAMEEAALLTLLDTGTVEWKERAPQGSVEEIVATFEKSAAAVNAKLERMDEAGWEKKGRFLMGGDPPGRTASGSSSGASSSTRSTTGGSSARTFGRWEGRSPRSTAPRPTTRGSRLVRLAYCSSFFARSQDGACPPAQAFW